ncbi:MAG TPA: hypothetical protein VE690_23065 [Rhodopila sp.]|nr:hypothetical protein [Rhodopila sp.]
MPALFALYAACAVVYGGLAALALPRRPHRRVELWFFAACLMTSAWAASVAVAWLVPGPRLTAWLEVARSAC